MPLLYRYLMGLFLGNLLRIVGVFTGMFLLLDGAEQFRRATAPGKAIHWHDLFLMIALRMPPFLVQLIPSMAMLAALITLAQMGRRQELTAARSGGISLPNLLAPFLLAAALVGMVQICSHQFLLPFAQRAADKLEGILVRGLHTDQTNEEFWSFIKGRVVHARKVEPGQRALDQVMIFHLDDNFRLREMDQARQADEVFKDRWRLQDGNHWQFGEDGGSQVEPFQQRPWEGSMGLELPRDAVAQPEYLSYFGLYHLIRLMETDGLDTTPYRVTLARRMADPAATLAAVLLAFPFALRLQRLGGVGVSLAAGVVSAYLLFVTMELSTALGLGGRLPPALAAWAPILFFAGIGGFLLGHVEGE